MDPDEIVVNDGDDEDHPHFEDALKAALAAAPACHQEAVKRYNERTKEFEAIGLDPSLIDARDILWEVYADSDEEKADEAFGDGDPSEWTW